MKLDVGSISPTNIRGTVHACGRVSEVISVGAGWAFGWDSTDPELALVEEAVTNTHLRKDRPILLCGGDRRTVLKDMNVVAVGSRVGTHGQVLNSSRISYSELHLRQRWPADKAE